MRVSMRDWPRHGTLREATNQRGELLRDFAARPVAPVERHDLRGCDVGPPLLVEGVQAEYLLADLLLQAGVRAGLQQTSNKSAPGVSRLIGLQKALLWQWLGQPRRPRRIHRPSSHC